MLRAKGLAIAAGIALAIGLSQPASANLIFTGTGTDSDGSPISATVDFSLKPGNIFEIVLTNNNVANSQASVLTNVGFNAVPSPAGLLPGPSGSASITPGSFKVVGPSGTLDAHTVGQEWAYLSGGAASSGFGVGTGSGNLCGTAGCGDILNGSSFGLVGIGTNLNQDGMVSRTYIENSMTIDITLPAPFSLSSITSVNFQYGTSAGEGSIIVNGCTGGSNCGGGGGQQQVPEPGSVVVLGTALAGLGLLRRRRQNAG